MTPMSNWMTRFCSTSLLALGLACGAASAQQAAPAQPAQTVPTRSFSDAQLEKFVSASQKVALISQEYTPKLQASEDESTRQQVYKEADQKMVEVVQAQGLTVDEFNGINQAIRQDPSLLQRVQNLAGQQQ